MGASRDDFVKYPRTPHLFGSTGTDDDRHLGRRESEAFLKDPSLIVEEKLDGTNVGIHFTPQGRMVLQGRGHLITEGMHPQYDLLKRWTTVKRPLLEAMLGDREILFGEWLYARHSLHYRKLPHFFIGIDLYDKKGNAFLDRATRHVRLAGTVIPTVPVVHRGPLRAGQLPGLIGPSAFGSHFEHPVSGKTDYLMEGLYLRTEADGRVTGRAKFVRLEFVEKMKPSEHWQHRAMIVNELAEGADIWA